MKHCVSCHQSFDISAEEKNLRVSIAETFEAGRVPEPTHCPPCRMQRRMARRNERFLYSRKSDLSGKPIISMYPENTPFPVYERTEWYSDAWDATSYGQEFDFSRPFFEQFHELQNRVPRSAITARNVTNSDYSNFCLDSKNCYLSHNSYRCEDLMYSYWMLECKNCDDCSYCFQSEQCFECTDCNHSYNCRSCVLSHNCTDSYFLYDCRGCTNCFGCVGLRRKSYHLFDEPLSKEEYEKKLASMDLENPQQLAEIQQKVEALRLKHPHRATIQDKTENCNGDYLFESKNCQNCFVMYRSEDCMYVEDAEVKNALDCYHPGWSQAVYESYSPVNQQSTAFVSQCWEGNDNFYCDTCTATTHCFGCVGLKHKNYCILNKQYSKEEYEKLVPKIIEHMNKPSERTARARSKEGSGSASPDEAELMNKEWGEFFPIEISPFCYNETMAQEYYSLTKEQALARGYRWRDADPKEYKKQTYQIPSHIREVPDTILQEILACESCGKNYRIIAQELKMYREKKIPIPRKCPDCRYKIRQQLRNPRKLWNRNCMKCSVAIKTSFSPERPEIVYCEACYLKEVY